MKIINMEAVLDVVETANELFLFLPLFILLLTVLGVLWSPFAAGSCALMAWSKRLDVKSNAVAGAKLSMLLILPWLYLLVKLIVGKKLMRFGIVPVAAPVYVLIYTLWLVGYLGVFNVAIMILGVRDIFWVREEPLELVVPLVIVVAILFPINAYTLWCSARRLIYRYSADRSSSDQTEGPIVAFDYLAPFVGLIGWSFVVLFSMTVAGLAAYTQM